MILMKFAMIFELQNFEKKILLVSKDGKKSYQDKSLCYSFEFSKFK